MWRCFVNMVLVLGLLSGGTGLSHAMHVAVAHAPDEQASHEHHGCCHHHHHDDCSDEEPDDEGQHQHDHDCAICKLLASGFADIAKPVVVIDTPQHTATTLLTRTHFALPRSPGPLPPRGPPHNSI